MKRTVNSIRNKPRTVTASLLLILWQVLDQVAFQPHVSVRIHTNENLSLRNKIQYFDKTRSRKEQSGHPRAPFTKPIPESNPTHSIKPAGPTISIPATSAGVG